MERRELIKNIALMVGGAISMPTLLAMQRHERGLSGSYDFMLSAAQRKLVAEVAEIIIPKTDTPGAIDAGVPAFIEMMLKDCYEPPEHQSFVEGLDALSKKDFLNKNMAEKISIISGIEQENKDLMKAYNVQQTKMGDNEDKELMAAQKKGLPFWRLMKELTLLGYFTSKVGVNASFDFVLVPGRFELTKLKPGQKIFAY
jgi:hypothetical protein